MDWNDWFEWRTLFYLYFSDGNGALHDIGAVKIARVGHTYLNDSAHATPLPDTFSALPDEYAAVAQDESFYENLRQHLGEERMRLALEGLGDLAVRQHDFNELEDVPVVSRSLLRSVAAVTVRTTYPDLIAGRGPSSYEFRFVRPSENAFMEAMRLDFKVRANSTPPTNVHVLIGRNGSGKTSALRDMARAMLGPEAGETASRFEDARSGRVDIANLVYVSFSAFDEGVLPVVDDEERYAIRYSYVGLLTPELAGKKRDEEATIARIEEVGGRKRTQSPDALAATFANSAWVVIREKSKELWRGALQSLESDPIFADADVSDLADFDTSSSKAEFTEVAQRLYGRLSSGHKIVLLTVTRLVQTVTERSMVLLDEPEGHLHPPLIAAFIRTLSNLMAQRNGVAIIATHSPVILQEVPRSCAYQISRSGDAVRADELDVETFGENVGVLTTSVFGLEVADSGFHRLLIESAMRTRDYSDVVRDFENQLGSDARALLRSWFTDQRLPTPSHEARRAAWRGIAGDQPS